MANINTSVLAVGEDNLVLQDAGLRDSKVSSFQSTPDNDHYPSEKLVKDSLDLKMDGSLKGANNGVAELNSSGKVPDSQLPTIPDVSTKYDTADTAGTAIDDADYIPFYDTSATARKKSLWSNIKSKLKTYFDGIYLTSHQDISGKADKAVPTDAGNVAFLSSSGNLVDNGVLESDLFDALDKRHSHSNKTVLDKIPSSLGTAGQAMCVNDNGDGLAFKTISGNGGLSNYDLTFSTLSNNTTNITFEANQQCYKRMTMTAGATLNFLVLNKGCNYLRIYNS